VIGAWLLGVTLTAVQPTEAPALSRCETKRTQDPSHWRGYTCIYVYARKTGDYPSAIKRARELVEAEPERTWARYILADLLLDSGLEGAPPLYAEVSREFAEQGDYESAALSRIAYAFSFDANGREAIEAELKEAAALAEKTGDTNLVARVRVHQARLMLRHGGPLGRTAQLLADAREASFPDGPYEQRKFVLLLEADLEQVRDRPERAHAKMLELAAISESEGDRYVAASVRVRRIAMEVEYPTLRRKGLAALAEELLALDLETIQDNPYAHAQYLCVLGDLASSTAEALVRYEACAERAEEVGASASLRSGLHGLGLARGDEAQLIEARRAARAHGRPGLFSQLLLARLRFTQGDRAGGAEAANELFQEIDRISARQGEPLVRARLLSSLTPYYDEISSWALGAEPSPPRENIEAALQVVERLRARTIADALEQADIDAVMLDDPSFVELGRAISEANIRLRAPELTDGGRAAMLGDLDVLERNEAALFDALVAGRSVGVEPTEPVSLGAVQAQLGPSDAIVSFQLAREPFATRWEQVPARSWVAVITANTVTAHSIPAGATLSPLVELYVGAVGDRDAWDSLGSALHRDLFESVLESLPPQVDRLTIVPDGNLHRLPFSALAPAGGPMLGDKFTLTRAPSLAVWLRLRGHQRPAGHRALAFIDPATGDPALDPLTYAVREGEALAKVADTVLREGAAASEAFFADVDTRGVSVIHFGAHAILDELHPARAAVVLAPGSPLYDGLVQPRELAAKPFEGTVVVLAACRGAAGPILADEGPMGLAHALFRGGARTVVASLWPLDDAHATRFFTRFYERLGEGFSVAEAVAEVRRGMQADGFEPAAWAGIVVLGDGEHVPLEARGRSWVPWAWGAAGLLGLGALGLFLRRRAAAH